MSDFTFVCNKKKKRRGKCKQYDEDSNIYFERLVAKILEAQSVVSSSDVYQSIQTYLENSLNDLEHSGISEIVCYGLGNISDDQNVRYQFGLVLELKKFFNSELFLYDPVFKPVEKDVMVNLNCSLIEINECGKRKATKPTIFFLPHCPHELLNNVIAANWGDDLCDSIIISNSVNEVCTTLPDKKLNDDLPYLLKVMPFVTEMEVHNSFKPVGAFNDLSVHIFLKSKYIKVCNDQNRQVEEISGAIGELVI